MTVKYVAFCKWQNMKLFYFKSRKKFRLVNYENFDEWRKKIIKKLKVLLQERDWKLYHISYRTWKKDFRFFLHNIDLFLLTNQVFFLPQPIISDLETHNFFQRFSNTFFNWRFSKKNMKKCFKNSDTETNYCKISFYFIY